MLAFNAVVLPIFCKGNASARAEHQVCLDVLPSRSLSSAKVICGYGKTMKMQVCGSAFLGFADRLARKIKKIIRGSLMSC